MISSLYCSKKHHLPCSFTGVRSDQKWSIAAISWNCPILSFQQSNRFQEHLYSLESDELFSTLQPPQIQYRKPITILIENVLTSYIPQFYQFRTLQQGPTMPCPHSLHIPLVMKKLHLDSFFPRATALWNRLQKDASPYILNLFRSSQPLPVLHILVVYNPIHKTALFSSGLSDSQALYLGEQELVKKLIQGYFFSYIIFFFFLVIISKK